MDNLWKEEKSNFFTKLRRKIKREKWLVHSEKQEFSILIKYPTTILGLLIFPDNSYNVTVFHNGNQIKTFDKIPEHSLEYMLKIIGNEMVNKYA